MILLPLMNRNIVFLVILLFSFKIANAQVVANFQLNSTSFCGPNSVLLIQDISAGFVATRTWTVNGPGGFASFSGTNLNESVTLTQVGAYSVKLEVCDALNVCNDTTRTIFVNQLPTAVITLDDSIACYGTQVNFSSGSSIFNTPGALFSWENDSNSVGFDEISPSFTFLANADIEIMLEVTDDNGCKDSVSQQLYIVQNEEAIFEIANNGKQCVGVPFDLTTPSTVSNSTLDSIYWVVDSTLILVGESQTYSHPVEDSISIILFVVNNYGCSDGMQRFVKIEEIPIVTTSIIDTVICEGSELLIVAEGASVYDWSTGETTDSIRVSPIEDADYTVFGTSQSGVCVSEVVEIDVNVIKKPTLTFDSENFNPTAGTPSEIEVDFDPKFAINDSLFWLDHGTTNDLSNTTGFENSFIANETVTFPVELVYRKDGFTCRTQDSVKFEIDEDCTTENVFVANTFTPNGDNLNDEFVISGFNIDKIAELVIFNRSGQEVYHTQNMDMKEGIMSIGWNGNNKNNVRCNSGVYVYSYSVKCLNGATLESSGNITLVR